jgi:hypothetical protein
VFVGRLSEAVLGEPAHRHQLTRERRPLGLLGIAHGLKQLRVTTSFEHIFDASARTDRVESSKMRAKWCFVASLKMRACGAPS